MDQVKSSKSLEMSSTAALEMRRFVMIAADARPWGDNVKARLARAARILGISPRRAKALYYLEAKVIPVEEYRACEQVAAEILNNASAIEKHNEYLASLGNEVLAVGEPPRAPTHRDDHGGPSTGSEHPRPAVRSEP